MLREYLLTGGLCCNWCLLEVNPLLCCSAQLRRDLVIEPNIAFEVARRCWRGGILLVALGLAGGTGRRVLARALAADFLVKDLALPHLFRLQVF